MMTQAVLIFFVAFLGYSSYSLASSLLNRPIIIGTLVGLVMGDLSMGIMVGAALELVWLGQMAIGASNPPDMVSGTIIGTSYVISTGAEVAAAVALAVPVAIFVQMIWNTIMAVIVPLLAAKADKYAEACNPRGIDLMHWVGMFIPFIILSLICSAGFYLGVNAVQGFIDQIPTFVMDGLNYAMGIIPAIGFAMLARMIANKKTACFLFLGFLLVAYGSMNLVGVTAAAAVLAAVLVFNTNIFSEKNEEVALDDNEF